MPLHALFPPAPELLRAHIEVPGGHQLHLRLSGHAHGQPVLLLHGGPGSGCSPLLSRFLDPERFLIIAPDQRGSGLSLPQGGLQANRLTDLLDDLEGLHQTLKLDRPWKVVGGSWGATLAMAHAAQAPHLVSSLLLRASFLGRDQDVDDFFSPQAGDPADVAAELARFRTGPHTRLVDDLYRALHGGDPDQALAAARAWWRWEVCASLPRHALTAAGHPPRWPAEPEPQALLARLRVQSHYLAQGCGLRELTLLQRAHAVPDVPIQLLHGLDDRVCPPQGATLLYRALLSRAARSPVSLSWLPGVGHDPYHPLMVDAMIRALAIPLQDRQETVA